MQQGCQAGAACAATCPPATRNPALPCSWFAPCAAGSVAPPLQTRGFPRNPPMQQSRSPRHQSAGCCCCTALDELHCAMFLSTICWLGLACLRGTHAQHVSGAVELCPLEEETNYLQRDGPRRMSETVRAESAALYPPFCRNMQKCCRQLLGIGSRTPKAVKESIEPPCSIEEWTLRKCRISLGHNIMLAATRLAHHQHQQYRQLQRQHSITSSSMNANHILRHPGQPGHS